MSLFVICAACNTEHYVDEVEALNIEEGPMGEDIVTFQCILSDTTQKSIVYGNGTHQSWSIHVGELYLWIDTETF